MYTRDSIRQVVFGTVIAERDPMYPNNVVAVDSNGDELWKINDILKIEKPSANTVIKKKSEKILAVLSSVGMVYEINIEQMKVVDSMIMR